MGDFITPFQIDEDEQKFIDTECLTFVRDIDGNEYPLQATITHEIELNGNQSISFVIHSTKVNNYFIKDIAEMWEVIDCEKVTHKVIYAKRKGEGERLTVEIKAIPLFFDVFNTMRTYEEYNRHMTAQECFSVIFEDSGFSFILVDSFGAIQWEGLGGGETKLESFKRAIERYGAEFKIIGNIVYLQRQIGRDTQFQYRYKLNASDIEQEVDGNEFWTYAKGYGDYGDGEGGEDWKDAKLKREYTSPLAKIPSIGIRHAPPIKNGNITLKETMDEALKTLVDESLKISVSATIHDLRKQGYQLAQPEVGDRVFLIDERIGLNEEVRVVDMAITRDWKGNVIDLTLTFGSEDITKRHNSNIQTAVNEITELVAGNRKLPYSVVDNRIIQVTEAIKSAQTELFFENGIKAIDKFNNNSLVLLNSEGVGISLDGGATFRTAITGEGIVADVITAGTINTDRITIYGGNSQTYTMLEGNSLESRGRFTRTWFGDTETHDVRIKIEKGYMRFRNDTADKSIYISDFGISTFIRGGGEDDNHMGSGTIEFFSKRWNPPEPGYEGVRGITMLSNRGTVAMEAHTRDVVLWANRDINTESLRKTRLQSGRDTTIWPYMGQKLASLPFQFYVKGNSGEWDDRQDGVIFYGDFEGRGTRTSGIRFRRDKVGMISATNDNGDWKSGDFYADQMVANGFFEQSTVTSKENIENVDFSGLYVINKLKVRKYRLKQDLNNMIYDDERVGIISQLSPEVNSRDGTKVNLYKLISYNVKATQELSMISEQNETDIKDIYSLLETLINDNEMLVDRITKLEDKMEVIS